MTKVHFGRQKPLFRVLFLMTFIRSKCIFDDKWLFPFHKQSYYAVSFAKNGNFFIAVFDINY